MGTSLHIRLILSTAVMLIWGCVPNHEDLPMPVEEGLVTQLRVDIPDGSYGSGGDPAAQKDNAEALVNSMWMNTLYPSTAIPSKADRVDVKIKNVEVKDPTIVTVHSGIRDIYTAVNLSDAQLVEKMETAQYKSDVQAIEYTLGERLPASPFVMSSVLKKHTLQAVDGGAMKVDVTLKALVARLDLTIVFDEMSENFKAGGKYEGWKIVLDHLQLANLPATTPLFESEVIPTYGTRKQTEKFAVVTIPDATHSSSWSCANKFYLPENLFADPANMDKATYAVIYARAIPPAGTSIEGGDTQLSMVMRIAIGNHVSDKRDFTIRRNNKYILKIKLVGMGPEDRVFVNSSIEEWIKDEIDPGGLVGNPGDAIFLKDYQLEANVLAWTEDARTIDKMGLPWEYTPDMDDGTIIGGEPWRPEKPGDETIGEGWN